MIGKEALLSISDLHLADIIPKMNESQYASLVDKLNLFVDSFSVQEEELKNCFQAKDYLALTKKLLSTREKLEQIHADDMAQDCLRLIGDMKTARREKVEAHFSYFLTAISMLSIDIQMAQNASSAEAAQAARAAPAKSEKAVSEAKADPGPQKCILAVDDVSFFLSALKSVLQGAPYRFVGVTSSADALRFVENRQPDLFILDIEMPEMNGYELASKLREHGCTAPIIFLTGNSARQYIVKAIQAGAADFIVKPIDKNCVLEKIEKHINA